MKTDRLSLNEQFNKTTLFAFQAINKLAKPLKAPVTETAHEPVNGNFIRHF